MNRYAKPAALLFCCVILAASAACRPSRPKTSRVAGNNIAKEQEAIATGFGRLSDAQPVPSFTYSQERQTLIDVETVRADGTHGTAYATTFGGELLWWCPTIGAPTPSTYQLSTNTQYVDLPRDHTRDRFAIEQGEPTGVYVGDSAATWTLCTDDQGTPFAKYEEANVGWTSGIVSDLPADRRARVDEITFAFTTEDNG